MKDKETKCKHEQTYVAVRHVGGLTIVKCAKCNQVVN
jgi:hypothetical protein